jgi:AraC-like DNA-binding protein
LRSAIYCRATMTGKWGFRVERRDHARFHFVKTGRCWLEADGSDEPIRLETGDLVILTGGQGHVLRASLDSPVEPLVDLLKRLPLDQKKVFLWENGGPCTTMLCGGFRLEEQRVNPLLSTLPPLLIVRDHVTAGISLRAAFELAEAEVVAGHPGSEALVSRMSDVIFLQAVRASIAVDCARAPGFIRGLSDPAVGRALAAIHSRLDLAWTVEALAKEVGMSRSAFSSRFAGLVGEPPMTYLSRWRLNRAALWLRSSDMKILKVSMAVGYDSEASLSRAFKRLYGLSPGMYRRHCAAADGDASVDPRLPERMRLYPSDFKPNGRPCRRAAAAANEP